MADEKPATIILHEGELVDDETIPPPPAAPRRVHRSKHPSLADIVEEAVEEAVAARIDSLIPINVEQLSILKRSDSERVRRSNEEARSQRFYKVLVLVLSIIATGLEIYRASHH